MDHRYIAFDVDGTLLGTFPVALQTFQQTLLEFTKRSFPNKQLYPAMGRSNRDALVWLGIAAGNARTINSDTTIVADLLHGGRVSSR